MPSALEIKSQNEHLWRRWEQFRLAGERVASALSELPEVQKISLIGSCARPLWKEVPRFREYRRARIEVWHEVKDVDLAVWLTEFGRLKELHRAKMAALNDLLATKKIGVASHQVEIFLFEPGSDRYQGRLCAFAACPKGKPDCQVEGCGRIRFLKRHENFRWRPEALSPDRSFVFYENGRFISLPATDGPHEQSE